MIWSVVEVKTSILCLGNPGSAKRPIYIKGSDPIKGYETLTNTAFDARLHGLLNYMRFIYFYKLL